MTIPEIPYIETETVGTEQLAEFVLDLYRRVAELERPDAATLALGTPEDIVPVAHTAVTLRVPVDVISEIRRVLDRMGEIDASGGSLTRKNAVRQHLGRELRAAVIRMGIPS